MVPAPFFVPVVRRLGTAGPRAGAANVANVETITRFFAWGWVPPVGHDPAAAEAGLRVEAGSDQAMRAGCAFCGNKASSVPYSGPGGDERRGVQPL